jgi:hypothetical protein
VSKLTAHHCISTLPLGQLTNTIHHKPNGSRLPLSPETKQTIVSIDVLEPFLDQFVVVYLDDILVYSCTHEDQVKHVRAVLEALRKENLKAKAGKCAFAQKEAEFLGYLVSGEGIKQGPAKIAAIKDSHLCPL